MVFQENFSRLQGKLRGVSMEFYVGFKKLNRCLREVSKVFQGCLRKF